MTNRLRREGADLRCCLLCGEDETPATIGKFQRRRLPSSPARAAAQDIAALNDEFGNDEDDWDLKAIDHSVAKAQHQKRLGTVLDSSTRSHNISLLHQTASSAMMRTTGTSMQTIAWP